MDEAGGGCQSVGVLPPSRAWPTHLCVPCRAAQAHCRAQSGAIVASTPHRVEAPFADDLRKSAGELRSCVIVPVELRDGHAAVLEEAEKGGHLAQSDLLLAEPLYRSDGVHDVLLGAHDLVVGSLVPVCNHLLLVEHIISTASQWPFCSSCKVTAFKRIEFVPDVKLFVPVPVLKRMKVVHDISPVDASNFSQSSRLQALPSLDVNHGVPPRPPNFLSSSRAARARWP